MKLKKLVLENFRLFKNLEIDFPDSNAIALIGNNGGGKTSVLDAVAKTLGGLIKKLPLKYVSNEDLINKTDIKKHENTISAIAGFNWHGNTITVHCNKETSPEVTPNDWFNINIKNSVFPILVYYRVNRTTTINKGTFHKIIDPASAVYGDALDAKTSSFSKFEDWFINELSLENEYKIKYSNFSYELSSLKNVRHAFKLFLGKLGASEITDIRIDRDTNAIDFNIDNNLYAVVIKNNEELRFSQLSAGEKMILYMVSDIARRLTLANSHNEDALQGEGIVLIDELDLHLHPKWQREIVKALTTTFPKVQFIFTTHSPQVISSLTQDQIIVLENGKVFSANNDPLGRDTNGILEEIMDTSERPIEVENKLESIFKELARPELNIDLIEKEINELKSMISEKDPVLIRINGILERKKALA